MRVYDYREISQNGNPPMLNPIHGVESIPRGYRL